MSTMEPDEGNQADAPRWEKTEAASAADAPRWERAEKAAAGSDDDATRGRLGQQHRLLTLTGAPAPHPRWRP